MKKRLLALLLASSMVLTMSACGKKDEQPVDVSQELGVEAIPEEETEVVEVAEEDNKEEVVEETPGAEDVLPEGMYFSELTNEPIDEALKNQRPIAAMIDNESLALPHYGVNQADVVYEMMNSTANGRITRMMALVKDWGAIEQLGSIRSVRPTNILIAAEWNAVICHDGGPFYIDPYLANDYAAHFSGLFSRVNNGKSREYTEYIMPGDLDKAFKNSDYSTEYDEYYPGQHFNFAPKADPVKFAEDTSIPASKIKLPFKHNGSYLEYNEEDGLYYYGEYGKPQVDAGDVNKQTSFKNVLLEYCTFHQYDDNGYMIFNCIDSGKTGYYITNGRAIHVTWTKTSDTDITKFFDEEGNEITLNTGKTYIALVPDDDWGSLDIQ